MKTTRFLALFLAFVLVGCNAGAQKNTTIFRSQVNSLISDFRHFSGVETTTIGPVLLSLGRTAMNIGAEVEFGDLDDEELAALCLLDGIKKIQVVDFEDCRFSVRENIFNRLGDITRGMTMLMEYIEDDDKGAIYVNLSKDEQTVKDFLIVDDETIVCVQGDFSLAAVSQLNKIR